MIANVMFAKVLSNQRPMVIEKSAEVVVGMVLKDQIDQARNQQVRFCGERSCRK